MLRLRAVMCMALVATAGCRHCCPPPPSDGPACPSKDVDCVNTAESIPTEQACPDSEWIGVRDDELDACPEVDQPIGGRWVARPLFMSKRTSPAPNLEPFCQYSWKPNDPQRFEPDLPSLRKVPGLSHMARDCKAVSGSSTPAVLATWETLRKGFLEQSASVDHLPVSGGERPVRVAVVDDSPDGYRKGQARAGQYGHGLAVGRIVREIACPNPDRAQPGPGPEKSCEGYCGVPAGARACGCDPACTDRHDCCADKAAVCDGEGGACIAMVSNHLALPLEDADTRNEKNGGRLGTLGDLARAIDSAVDTWLAKPSQSHLVINLSVGWDRRIGGPDPEAPGKLSGPIRAVHASLERAACLGALVVAAAGNDSGGPQAKQGPLYPAGWETEPMPTPDQCKAIGATRMKGGQSDAGPGSKTSVETSRRPLLYSAGGLLGNDKPLPTGREGGRPRLAAPAAHAVAVRYDQGTLGPTRVLSGTSVAAALVSGVASVVWGYRPELDAGQVMDLVYGSAVPLGEPADYCLGGEPCPLPAAAADREIRRVGLCPALIAACKAGSGACPKPSDLPKCALRPAFADASPVLSAAQMTAIAAVSTGTTSAAAVAQELAPLHVCGLPKILHTSLSAYPDPSCPTRQYYGPIMSPNLFPQPGSIPCPVCSIRPKSPTGTLQIEIDPAFEGQLRNPTVTVNGVQIVVLPGMSLVGGSAVTVDDILLPAGPLESAALSYTVFDPDTGLFVGSETDLLLVQPSEHP